MKLEAVIAVAIVAAAGCVQSSGAWAQQGWRPVKAVELIIPTAPGGANDQVARAIQKVVREEKLVATPVEAINKPGGNQSIAVAYLQQHSADPHYLLIANPTLIGSHISGVSAVNYTDLTPLALLLSEHTVFSVPADSPIRTVRELFDRVKADPEAVAFGVVSRGGPSHLALSAAASAAGIDARKLKTVVFKTNPESLTAMVGGHIQAVASSVSSALGYMKSGRTRVLAIVSPQRMTGDLAHVPTAREQGLDVTQASWRVVFGAKGITAPQIAFWEETLSKMAAADEWKKTLAANHWAGSFLRGKELTAYLETNYRLTRNVMSDLGLVK